MPGAIFLSASVPDPKRNPEFAKTADVVAITAAVSALVHVTLGRRQLVWGGHPAITPMIVVVAKDLGVNYSSWVKLYQSEYFEDEYPEDNIHFQNVVFTKPGRDRRQSLRLMRQRMLGDQGFDAAVFVGGMRGILDEFMLFRKQQPSAAIVPVLSAGGAASELAEFVSSEQRTKLLENLDYVALFHNYLQISAKELRYVNRDQQPDDEAARLWKHS
jgi:SLOG cluster3 family